MPESSRQAEERKKEGEVKENKWEYKRGGNGRGGGRMGTGGRGGGRDGKNWAEREREKEKEAGDCVNPFQILREEGEVGEEEDDPGPEIDKNEEKDEDYEIPEQMISEEMEEEIEERREEIIDEEKRKCQELNLTPEKGNQKKAKASRSAGKSKGSSKRKR